MRNRKVGATALAVVVVAMSMAAIAAIAASAGASTGRASALPGAEVAWRIFKPTNTGIQGDYVTGLAIDASGRTWVAANDPIWDEGGLARFDGSTWKGWSNVDRTSPTHEMSRVIFGPDGAIWTASAIGLLRFDGRKVRVAWSAANAPWPTSHVTDFAWDSAGTLWVGLADVKTVKGGLARYDGSTWTVFTTANGLPWDAPWDGVTAVEVDAHDRIWIGSDVLGGAMFDGTDWTWMKNGWVDDIAIVAGGDPWYAFATGGVEEWNGSNWIDRTPPVFTSGFSLLTKDRAGNIWAGTFIGQIWRYRHGAWDLSYTLPSLSHVYALAFDRKDRPWAGGIGGLDALQKDRTWKVYTTQNTGLTSRWIDDITLDTPGRVWFGTAGGGLSRFDGTRWADFNPANWGTEPWPFATDSARGGVEDDHGRFWTTPMFHGIGVWDGSSWKGYEPFADFSSIVRDPDGTLYASGASGVFRFDGSVWVTMDPPAGGEIGRMTVDGKGRLWVASITGLLRHDAKGWRWYTSANSGLPGNFVIAVAADPGGGIWVGTDQGLARFDGKRSWTVYTMANSGLPADVITSLAVAPSGVLWVGAFDGSTWPYHGGVAGFDGTDWVTYTTENSPLPHEQVQALAVDPTGNVWVGTASEGAAVILAGPR